MKLGRMLRLALASVMALAWMTEAARADPVTAIITAVSAAFKAYPILAAVASAAFTTAANSLLAKWLTPDQKVTGVKQDIDTGGDNPLSFVMGQFATAGKMAYVNQCGLGGNELNNSLTLVISLSELPVTALSNLIWINGELCTIDFDADGDPDDLAPSPGFHPVTDYDKLDNPKYGHQYCWIKFHDGTQTTADSYLTDTFGDDHDKPWTSDMIGRGCAYAIVVARYSGKGIWSGIPSFKFVLKGIPLYDISKDSTAGGSGSQRWMDQSTWGWSENPKVMAFNVARGIYYNRKWIWGGQTGDDDAIPYASDPPSLDDPEAYQFPSSYWLAAIAHCNENVTKADDSEIARYTAACEISIDRQPIDVIRELDKCCAGFTVEYGGIWKTWAGPPGTSVLSITDDDIIITEEQNDDLFKADIFNAIRATYTKPAEGWVNKECAPRYFDDLIEEDDDFYQIADLQLPFVTEGNQVQRLMRLSVLDSRKQITHNLQLPPSAFFLEEFDVITWTSERNGYVNKKFQVRAIDDLPNCNQQVVFRECDPDDYDWDVEFELPESVGVISPVKPGALALDFTVSAAQVRSTNNHKDRPAVLIEWTWGLADVDLDYVRWELRKQGDTEVIAHGIFHNVEDTSRKVTSAALRFNHIYEIRLLAEPERKWRGGTWTGWKTVNLNLAPTAPTVLEIDAGSKELKLRIDKCVDADYRQSIVMQSEGFNDFDNAVEVARFHGTQTTIKRDGDDERLVNGISYFHWVINEDTSESVSSKFPAGDHAGVLGKPAPLGDTDINPFGRSKTRQAAKAYSGTTTDEDLGFVSINVDNDSGNAVKLEWDWHLTARYNLSDYTKNSTTIVKATLWKRHGADPKHELHTVHARVKHPAGSRKNLHDSIVRKDSKSFIDAHPRAGAVTTYGIDIEFRGTGHGSHHGAVRNCNLTVSWSTR